MRIIIADSKNKFADGFAGLSIGETPPSLPDDNDPRWQAAKSLKSMFDKIGLPQKIDSRRLMPYIKQRIDRFMQQELTPSQLNTLTANLLMEWKSGSLDEQNIYSILQWYRSSQEKSERDPFWEAQEPGPVTEERQGYEFGD